MKEHPEFNIPEDEVWANKGAAPEGVSRRISREVFNETKEAHALQRMYNGLQESMEMYRRQIKAIKARESIFQSNEEAERDRKEIKRINKARQDTLEKIVEVRREIKKLGYQVIGITEKYTISKSKK